MARNQTSPSPIPKDLDRPVDLDGIARALRKRAGLTLNELAERSGVSASTVSKIETGQLLPGYETILKLAMGLDVEVAELFQMRAAEVPTGRRGVTRRGEGIKYSSPHYVYEALASDLSKKHFLPLIGTIKARSVGEFNGLPAHDGEELVYVLSGAVRLYSEHYEPLDLEPGDSAYIDSHSGHALVSTSTEDAKVVWICSDINALRASAKSKRGKNSKSKL